MSHWQGILTGLILSLVLCTGCLFSPSVEHASPVSPFSTAPTSPVPTFSTAPTVTLDRADQGSPALETSPSRYETIHIALHNITVLSRRQKSGKEFKIAVLDISLRNDGVRALSLGNMSLACFESDHEQGHRLYPETGYFQETGENPLLPCRLFPGQEKRGTVIYQVLEGVDSMVLYVKYPNWTIAGELFIPEIANGSQGSSDSEYPKNLGMIVHSAVQRSTLLGMTLTSGNRYAVINVSITNHGTADVRIRRENLFILTEREITYEHGGERVTEDIARQFFRFPLVIHPGETRIGPILYIVFPGTRINRLVLTDRNFVIHSIVDLNNIYRYE